MKIRHPRRFAAVVLSALCLVSASNVLARPGGAGQGTAGQGIGQGAAAKGAAAIGVLARYLELTDEQIAQIRTLAEDTHAVVQPLREELQTAHQSLADLLAADTPDATAIGEQV
ncbi:MAG: periplasmic heavy metal sensor, partial [Acidobacteria bacterium]|nr:periplasmic heavy metal sensor [Acidobacteriota bacterium]